MSDFEFTPPDVPESTLRAFEAALERGRPLPVERLIAAANRALLEMCNTTAPRNSFTDAVDELDAAIDGMRPPAVTGGQFGDPMPYPKGAVMGQREAASAQQDEREAMSYEKFIEDWQRSMGKQTPLTNESVLCYVNDRVRRAAQQVQADAGPTAAQWDDLNADMGEIIAALGLSPDSYGGAEPIVQAIEDLKARASQVQADAGAVAIPALTDPDDCDAWCPRCNGSGEETVMSNNGPDAYEQTINCQHCDGKQTLYHAYAGVVRELAQVRKAQLETAAKQFVAKHARKFDHGRWIQDNYHDHPNITSLVCAMNSAERAAMSREQSGGGE